MFYIFPKEVFPLFREMELSSPRIKKLLIFQEGNFQARKIKKKKNSKTISYIFSKKNFFLYFGKQNFLAPSLKNSYIFSKKNFLIYQEGTCKARKTKKIHSEETFYIFAQEVILTFRDDFMEPITEPIFRTNHRNFQKVSWLYLVYVIT